MRPSIFMDRDGVIIENRENYIRTWDDIAFVPNAVEALAAINNAPYSIVLVTNQSVVGRGLISLKAAQAINEQLIDILTRSGCRIDGVFMCPHTPDDHCNCRKPKPGLILQAAQALDLDIPRSIMIGDAWSDVQAGVAAGIPTNVLVKTGRGQEQLLLPRPTGIGSIKIFVSLADALHDLVQAQ